MTRMNGARYPHPRSRRRSSVDGGHRADGGGKAYSDGRGSGGEEEEGVRGRGNALAGTTVEGWKEHGCGRGDPRLTQMELIMPVILDMWLLDEQINLYWGIS